MEKTDLRIIKTKAAIESALFSLIEEKGFQNVRLIDIAERAKVNRNTIYQRYGTKEDIVLKIIEEKFKTEFAKMDISSYLTMRRFKPNIRKIIETVFSLINNDIEVYRLFLTDVNLYGYINNFTFEIRKFLLSKAKPGIKNELTADYIVNGSFGVIKRWIIYGTGTIDDNINELTDMICVSIRRMTFKLWDN